MGRKLEEVIDSLSPEMQQKIESETKDLILEVEATRLKQLRERYRLSRSQSLDDRHLEPS